MFSETCDVWFWRDKLIFESAFHTVSISFPIFNIFCKSVACKFAFRQTSASDRRRCPHFGTSDVRVPIKITRSFVCFLSDVRGIAENFYKLQDFIRMLDNAIRETLLNFWSAVETTVRIIG